MNEKGLATDADEKAAGDLYQKAVRNGSVDAQRALDRLSAKAAESAPPAPSSGPSSGAQSGSTH
jgi:hypothetical protein